MFTAKQRDKIYEAILNRAEDTNTKRAEARHLKRAANDRRVGDRLIERKAAQLRKQNPKAGDGEILKMLLDWISNGGLAQIIALILQLIPK